MTVNPKEKLKALYQALKDQPLEPDSEYYVPFVKDSSAVDPIAELFTGIDFAESESLHLISGQRGTGKSTELRRLKQDLTQAGYIVFSVDVLDYLNDSEPVDISDFLLAAIAGLAESAKKNWHLDKLHENYWQRLGKFLKSDVQLESVDLKQPGANIKLKLKRDPSFKQQLNKAIKGHISQLLDQVHEFVTQLVEELRKQSDDADKQVVLIIDSFEQIRGHSTHASEVHDSVVRLLSVHGENLRLPMLHVVISIPPYLSTAAPNVASTLGSSPQVTLPSIHVRNRVGSEDEAGLNILGDIVKKRCENTLSELITEDHLRSLAFASGGDLRDFFNLIRAAVTKASTQMPITLPIVGTIIEQAKESLQRSMLPITDDDVRWLHKVMHSKQAELESLEDLPRLGRLFDYNLIINYRNGDDWYDIHPLIEEYVVERIKVLDERQPATDD